MQPLENIDEQIKDVILVNGGDINISDYPYLIKEAEEAGINSAELARRIRKVFETIDWRPYNRIDKMLENIILKGSLFESEAEEIVKDAENDLQRPKAVNYILASVKKRGFLPREKNSFEHDSFKNKWMTEETWTKYEREKITVEWLSENAHSLAQMGEISYRKTNDAKYYLRNTNYLVPNVTMLTKSATKADEFSKIIEDEPNPDKRYLKVVYRLNPKLPFHLINQDFANIYTLFDASAASYTFFVAAADSYQKGHIHIWINQTDAINADKLTGSLDYNSFLSFLYKVNNHHPFYLESLRFDTPQSLIQSAQTDTALWNKIAEAAKDQQIMVWLGGVGRLDWVNKYNERLTKINASSFYSDDEKKRAGVQSLIQIVDPTIPNPLIASDQNKIQLLAVEGSKTVQYSVRLTLENTGFAKADLFFYTPVNGVSLSNRSFVFWSQNNEKEHTLVISIAALQLVKNKLYTIHLHIDTEYQNIVIPVEIKVVFPVKAYLMQVAKYALFGALFFALVRYVTGVMANQLSWFQIEPAFYNSSHLPERYFAYFAGLFLLLAGLAGAVFLIKKIEKI